MFCLYGACVFFPRNPFAENTVKFSVKKGEGSKEISANLEEIGLIRFAPVFRVYVLLSGSSKKLQAGNYELSRSMSIYNIVNKLENGSITENTITIIEGWNLSDVGRYLQENNITTANNFWKIAGYPAVDYSGADLQAPKDFSSEYAFLSDKPKNVGLEGYLFPDTYEIRDDMAPEEIVEKMLDNFDKKLTDDMRQEIKRQNKTIFEIVTMASLLEKEVKSYEDKQIVSGIFWKRMDAGMSLDSCASISYILGEDKKQYSFEDTRTPSLFNTYLHAGLPLGPISNPGVESIKAAIYPKTTPYWYFLSASDGRTIFSRTFSEHNIAKVKYLE